VLARGQHSATSFGGCTGCHGPDLSGSPPESFGPIGVMSPPNITAERGGAGGRYTDAELAGAIRYGVRHDGTSLTFLPTEEHAWWTDDDLQAVVSYIRSVPPVDAEREPSQTGVLGKVLTGFGVMDFRSAIATPKSSLGTPPNPEPTARCGAFLAIGCKGCHGDDLSGGPIPGAPADLPMPANHGAAERFGGHADV
jgi:mono/diheme cytochrome c family protein